MPRPLRSDLRQRRDSSARSDLRCLPMKTYSPVARTADSRLRTTIIDGAVHQCRLQRYRKTTLHYSIRSEQNPGGNHSGQVFGCFVEPTTRSHVRPFGFI
eukprot:10349472-Prorocentrum_lima.AAC.1